MLYFSVGRMIKYTGFGNAAGLFANRGLLCKTSNPDYSSDSEDSDTEEYLSYKDQSVNNFKKYDKHPIIS